MGAGRGEVTRCPESVSSGASLEAPSCGTRLLGFNATSPTYLLSGFGSVTMSGFLPLHNGNDISNDLTRFLWGLNELV